MGKTETLKEQVKNNNDLAFDENQSDWLKQKKRNKLFNWKKNSPINLKEQIFKIVLTGILLGLSVALSLIEIKIPIVGAHVPLRIFDILIMAIAIPIIKLWYTLIIAILEPWLHFAIDSDHPPIQMFFDNIANIIFVVSFVIVFYQLFKNKTNKYCKTNNNYHESIIRHTFAGLILIPLNAIVASFSFIITVVILANSNLSGVDEYLAEIAAFYQNGVTLFFILLAIELARFLFIYLLFALVQKRLARLNRF
ncbi:MAG: hypothetical protein REH79_02575 [Spiroplasma sp.]|nr:hypothetical protein [Spiroplasma sp.]